MTYLGAAHAVELGADSVLLDLGGGVWSSRGGRGAGAGRAEPAAGAIRMRDAFLRADPPGRRELAALDAAVREALEPHVGRFRVRPGTRVVLSSGTAEAAAEAILARRGEEARGVNGTRLSVTELGELLEYVRGLKGAARARVPGLERRADTVVAGLATLHAALGVLGAQEFTVSEVRCVRAC